MLIAKTKIRSCCSNSKVYAHATDKLLLIEVNEHVGIYENLETGERFPTHIDKVIEIEDSLYERSVADESEKKLKELIKKRTANTNPNQISMF